MIYLVPKNAYQHDTILIYWSIFSPEGQAKLVLEGINGLDPPLPPLPPLPVCSMVPHAIPIGRPALHHTLPQAEVCRLVQEEFPAVCVPMDGYHLYR